MRGASPATTDRERRGFPAASELHSGCECHDLAVPQGVVGSDLQGRVPGHIEEILLAVFGPQLEVQQDAILAEHAIIGPALDVMRETDCRRDGHSGHKCIFVLSDEVRR